MNKYLLKLYEAYDKTKPYETDIAKDYELNKAQYKVKETKSIIMKHLIKILPKNEAKNFLMNYHVVICQSFVHPKSMMFLTE